MGKKISGSLRAPLVSVIGVSGGPDSVFLLDAASRSEKGRLVVGHLNHGTRGRESDEDARFVLSMARARGADPRMEKHRGSMESGSDGGGCRSATRSSIRRGSGFEERARDVRRRFLLRLKEETGAGRILLAHTADDQVETVLMRFIEGAGIAGLKGIPRRTGDGIERPLLDTWREEILEYLGKHKIPYRVDASNEDIRFERNWIRHVLIPLLEKRYGKAVKRRIHALGERFREIDEFLEATARGWMRRHLRGGGPGAAARGKGAAGRRGAAAAPGAAGGPGVPGRGPVRLPRRTYSRLPAAVRKRVVQILFHENLGISPNERLLESVDRTIAGGSASAALDTGKGTILRCRYDEAVFHPEGSSASRGPRGRSKGKAREGEKEGTDEGPRRASSRMDGPGRGGPLVWEERGRVAPAALRRLAEGERGAVFDASALRTPLAVRPLRAGDRIRLFGLGAEKKVKEILIDRKVPREERWGRPVVCDATGAIVWIPGIARSDVAPVTPATSHAVVLRLDDPRGGRRGPKA